ncbi:MAG: glycosyltransferase family 39 protein [Chloroflexi bacterium]|nr:glycosyltransferase family 39 protein [Chloroflexota bacterium]
MSLLVALLLTLAALPPRLLATDRFVTTDELFWVGRAAAFGRAIETGQFSGTFQTGHPGVTTMWTAWLGMGGLASDLAPSRKEVSRREVSQSPAFLPGLAAARRAFGVVTALGIGLLTLLAWRLFGPGPAVLGGLLLALDPFFLAHSRLVHIDASLTLWLSLAVAAGLARWQGGGQWTLVLCGVAGGLALLSKSPALILVGLMPLILLPYRGVRLDRTRLPGALRDLAVWGLIAALTFVVVWPAVWSDPTGTASRFLAFVRDNSNPDNAAAADDRGVGVWFYPLVFLFRATPLMLVGLLGLLLPPWRRPEGRASIMLLVYALGFGAAMTVAAKGFDRYLLPIFPALDLLAGLGWWRLVTLAAETVGARAGLLRRQLAGGAAVGLLFAASGGWWIWSAWPYELTYANPLLGGNPAAHRTIASGWGEGLDAAARYLNERTAGSRLRVAMPGEIYTTVLDAQLNGTVAPAEGYDAGVADALVVYLRNNQLGERPPYFDEELLAWTPEYTVILNGVPYAWVYSTRAGAPVAATFGDVLSLDGYGLDTATPRVGRRLELRLRWRALQTLPAGLGIVVELRPTGGGRPVRLTLPLEPTGEPTRWPAEERVSVSYQLPLDPALPAGDYLLAVRVVGADGEQAPVTTQPRRPAGVPSEADAVPLRRVQVRP